MRNLPASDPQDRRGFWLCVPLLVTGAAFLVWPLISLVLQSLTDSEGRWTLAAYQNLVAMPAYLMALWHSLALSLFVACVATSLCIGPAWFLSRPHIKGGGLVRMIFALPMSFSGVIVGFIAVLMVGRIGFIPQVFERWTTHAWFSGLAYRFSGLVLAYLFFEIPRATHTLEAAFERFDERLESAARSLGASPFQRLFWVVLPLLRPALVSTFGVTFAVSLGSFGVALIIARRFSVLPLEIFQQYLAYQNPQQASAMAVSLIVLAVIVQKSTTVLSRV